MQYDHLNYAPPANKWKAHYQRMANGFPVPNAQSTSNSREQSPTPPIPPLPKVNGAPIPPKREIIRDDASLNVPIPPERDASTSSDNTEPNSP